MSRRRGWSSRQSDSGTDDDSKNIAENSAMDNSVVDGSSNANHEEGQQNQQMNQNIIETNTDGGHREVYSLYYFSDNAIHSAKVHGSLEGEERAKFITEKRLVIAALNEERKSKV